MKDELKPTYSNSHLRFKAVENRMSSDPEIKDELIKTALLSRDNEDHFVGKSKNENEHGFTFASIIMTHTSKPNIQILADPPDESEHIRIDFTAKN